METSDKQLKTALFPGRSTERPYTRAGVGKNITAGENLAVGTLRGASDKTTADRPPCSPDAPRSVPTPRPELAILIHHLLFSPTSLKKNERPAPRVGAGRYVVVMALREKALCLCHGLHVDVTAAFFTAGEHNCAVNESVDGVILAHAYVETGVMHCAALTFDNVACLGELTAKNLNTESFAFRLTAVLRRTYTFLMCHFE